MLFCLTFDNRYRDSEDDVRNMESSFSQIEKEEIKR